MAASSADEIEAAAGRDAAAAVAVPRDAARRARRQRPRRPRFAQALADGDDEPEGSGSPTTSRSRRWSATARAWSTSCCDEAWALHAGTSATRTSTLVAVGGYGRGELHPCSDIDVLILLPKSEVADGHEGIERFLTFLWDIGLEVGHSVRTIDDCQRESAADVSVATTLIEARLLAGPDYLFQAMRRALGQDSVWSSQAFFEAKVAEQQARHHRHHDTAYNLEPNVKTSPGGLRDIQTIGWVAKRHFGAETFDELVEHGFLTAGGAAQAAHRAGLPVEGALRAARASPAGARTGCCSTTRSGSRRCSATRTRPTRSRSSSSCSATTAPSWT